MDYTDLVITVGIIVYGVLAYQRREQMHKEAMGYINRGQIVPKQTPQIEAWKLTTTGGMSLVVLAAAVWFTNLGLRIGKADTVLYAFGAIFGLLSLLLVLMFFRDLKKYRKQQKSIEKVRS